MASATSRAGRRAHSRCRMDRRLIMEIWSLSCTRASKSDVSGADCISLFSDTGLVRVPGPEAGRSTQPKSKRWRQVPVIRALPAGRGDDLCEAAVRVPPLSWCLARGRRQDERKPEVEVEYSSTVPQARRARRNRTNMDFVPMKQYSPSQGTEKKRCNRAGAHLTLFDTGQAPRDIVLHRSSRRSHHIS